jgi:hypothetical protein
MKLPSFVEPTYGASILDWVRQTYDGRLNFEGLTTSVEDLTGRAPQTLENWVRANRHAVLSAAFQREYLQVRKPVDGRDSISQFG